MSEAIVLPGIGNSDHTHWQTYWQKRDQRLRRFQPNSWNNPLLSDWIAALEQAISLCHTSPFLIAHSLACLLVAHWALETTYTIRGAFLVAVPDPTSSVFPEAAVSFVNVPRTVLPFPTLIVASNDDPFASADYSVALANCWNAGIVVLENRGHINNLQEWTEGQRLFDAFKAGTR